MDDDDDYVLDLSDGTPALLCWKGVWSAGNQGVLEQEPCDLEAYPMFVPVFFVLVIVPFPSDWQVVHGHHVRYSGQWSAWGRLRGVDAGILQVLDVQFYRSVADVGLACYSVGDEPGAVLAEKIDLSAGMADGGINVRISLIDVLNDGDLFLNGW